MFKIIPYPISFLNFPENIVSQNVIKAHKVEELFYDFMNQSRPHGSISGAEVLIVVQRYQSRPYMRKQDWNKPVGFICSEYDKEMNLEKWKAHFHKHTFGVLAVIPIENVIETNDQTRQKMFKAVEKMGLTIDYEDPEEFNQFNNEVVFVMEQGSLKDIYILGYPSNARKGEKFAEYRKHSFSCLSKKVWHGIDAPEIQKGVESGNFVLLSSFPKDKQGELREWAEQKVKPLSEIKLGYRAYSIYFTGHNWFAYDRKEPDEKKRALCRCDTVQALREKLFLSAKILNTAPRHQWGIDVTNVFEHIPTPNIQAEYHSLAHLS